MKYTAYTYLLTHAPTKTLYYGVRYSVNRKNMEPEKDLWVDYFTSSKKVHELIEAYGADSFEVTIDQTFDNREDAIAYEEKYLVENKVQDNPQYLNGNIAGAIFASEESYQKISEFHKGKPKSDEHKRKISEALKGQNKDYCKTPEYRKNMSDIMQGENNPRYGAEVTPETREKISQAKKGKPAHNKGKPMSEEQKAKLSARMKGRKLDPEVVARRAKAQIGQKRPKKRCPHCNQDVAVNVYPRWHGDNCKNKP